MRRALGAAALLGALALVATLAYPEPWLFRPRLERGELELVGVVSLSVHESPRPLDPITLQRDGDGVVHVRATTLQEAYIGLGFAMARDRAFQMDELVSADAGRPLPGPRAFDPLLERGHVALQSFAYGANAFLEHAGEHPSPRHRLSGATRRPWQESDPFRVLRALAAAPVSAGSPCPPGTWPGCAGLAVAVPADRSASGAPLLAASWIDAVDALPSRLYPARLETPDGFLAGLFIAGTPVALMGRTERHAWIVAPGAADDVDEPGLGHLLSGLVGLGAARDRAAREETVRQLRASGFVDALVLADRELDALVVEGTRRPVALETRLADPTPIALDELSGMQMELVNAHALRHRTELLALLDDVPELATGREVLAAWNGRCERDSRGCALYETLRGALDADDPEAALRAAHAALAERFGPHPDAWSWGALRPLEMRGASSDVPLLGRWFRRGPFALEGCPSCALVTAAAPGDAAERPVTTGLAARFLVDLADPARVRYALPSGASGRPFDRPDALATERWVAGRLSTLAPLRATRPAPLTLRPAPKVGDLHDRMRESR